MNFDIFNLLGDILNESADSKLESLRTLLCYNHEEICDEIERRQAIIALDKAYGNFNCNFCKGSIVGCYFCHKEKLEEILKT